jgi:hypothetical protein
MGGGLRRGDHELAGQCHGKAELDKPCTVNGNFPAMGKGDVEFQQHARYGETHT